jgi:hypothetical protein
VGAAVRNHDPNLQIERRRSRRRWLLDEHGITAVRVRPGCDAALVDVSSGGALVETTHRLMPGTSIEVQLHVRSRRVLVRGRVLRSEVSRLGLGGPMYRAALNFDRTLPWLTAGTPPGYAVPMVEGGAILDERGAATPQHHAQPSTAWWTSNVS